MGFHEKLRDLRRWCPQPPKPASTRFRHRVSITILLSAAILTVTFSLATSPFLFHQTPAIPPFPQTTETKIPTNTWAEKTPMPTDRVGFGAAVVKGIIYII